MPTVTQTWNHTEPWGENLHKELQLLTIGGISVLGRWSGKFGEHYVGWAKPAYIALSPYNPVPQRSNDVTHSLS